MKREIHKKEEGFVLVVVAVLLVVLIAFVALGVDVGVLYSARTSAQEAADAAALAGAFTFISNSNAPQPATATTHATQVAVNNSIFGQPIAAGQVNVTVDIANKRVTVDIANTQNTYFARVFGTLTADIGVHAVAEASTEAVQGIVKPWFVPNSVFASPKADCTACNAPQQLLITTTEPHVMTDWAKTKVGQSFTVKPQSPNGAIAPGQFYAIDLPDSQGGNDYRTNIATNSNATVRCAQNYSVLTGNKVGPTKQGVDDLLGKPPTDTWVAPGQYQTPSGLSDVSKALVLAPIWDSCAAPFCPGNNFPSGTNVNLKVVGFAVLFLDGLQGSDVKAHFITATGCGEADADEITGSSVLSLPLRLVRVP